MPDAPSLLQPLSLGIETHSESSQSALFAR